MGTPEVAVKPLEKLIQSKHEVLLTVTQPDKQNSRRGNKIIFSPVKQCAIDNGIEVFQPQRVSDEENYEYIKSKIYFICSCAQFNLLNSKCMNLTDKKSMKTIGAY